MSWRRALSKFGALFRRRKPVDDVAEEIRFHLDIEERENLESGMPPDEAHYAALRRFGNVALTEERSREMWGWNSVETLWQDVRYGLRMLARNRGFTAVAVLTLALGIGANSTIFSVISVMLLRKPPVHDPDRLVMLSSRNPGTAGTVDEASRSPVSPPDFLDWRGQATAFSGIAAASSFEDGDHVTLSGGTEPERVPSGQVSANYFQVLGVTPLLGRGFMTGEDQPGHDRVAVLREDLWKRRFAADPGVLGRTVKVNGDAYTVIGIIPDSFRRLWIFPEQLWIPLVFTSAQLAPAGRKARNLSVFGRLKPGVSEAQARSELQMIAQRIAAANPDSNKGWGANVLTLQEFAIQESNSSTPLAFLMATVGFVLLIACANLANLLLARNSNRQREFSIRAALGAGRFRLARQLLSESLLLGLSGGGLGLLFAVWGLRLLRAAFNWNDWSFLIAEQLSIDRNVMWFTLAISAATALFFGLAPAFQISRRDPNAGLKESSRGATAGREHHRLQNLLVVGQLALSVILLVGAGLFIKSFIEEMQAKPGMNPHNVLTASVELSGPAYKNLSRQSDFFQKVLRQLRSFPQVQAAAVTNDLPYTFPADAHIAVEGRPVSEAEKEALAGYFAVSPDYFTTTGIPLRGGREFTPSDNLNSAPVAIVNEAFVRKFLPNEDPLGRHVSISHPNSTDSGAGAPVKWREIVGVVGNVNEYLGQQVPRPHIFEPFLQRPDWARYLVVRTRTDPGAFAASLRRAVWSVDKDQPVTNLRTMDRVMQDAGQGDELMAELMGGFAGMALLMAALGIYGLVAYLVSRRTHELGVRMALGARRRELLLLVLRNSVSLMLGGAGIGFLVSLAIPKLVAASFSGFHVHSGWVLAGTPPIVILVGLASCYLPARRASRVDPMEALRYE